MSNAAVGSTSRARPAIPETLRIGPADLMIFLARSRFLSFTGPFDADGRRVLGILGPDYPPMSLPNVARNVIAHEIGHAIGLGHNADPRLLMCGHPAHCRPAEFRSEAPRLFPLSEQEKRQLLDLYPRDWRPR